MMKLNRILAMGLAAGMLLTIMSSMGPVHGQDAGTRSGDVGWQYDTFAENIDVTVTPENPTTLDTITVTITSKVEEVWIGRASMYMTIYPYDAPQRPDARPFLKISNTVFVCEIPIYGNINGYRIDFYIVAYDYFFTPMDSRDSMSFSYDVVGSGWRHDSFDDNIELEYWPLRANATEEVNIIIRSRDNVTISGANLYITFETPEGDLQEGGWNFTKTNVNSTEMRRTIPGYPAGTNITFWVTAWDQYNAVITSRFYNYSVMGISEYTDFPFEYTDGDRSLWIPDDAVLLPMAGMAALAIPLFIYLYVINRRRRERTVDLIKSKDAAPEERKVGPNE